MPHNQVASRADNAPAGKSSEGTQAGGCAGDPATQGTDLDDLPGRSSLSFMILRIEIG